MDQDVKKQNETNAETGVQRDPDLGQIKGQPKIFRPFSSQSQVNVSPATEYGEVEAEALKKLTEIHKRLFPASRNTWVFFECLRVGVYQLRDKKGITAEIDLAKYFARYHNAQYAIRRYMRTGRTQSVRERGWEPIDQGYAWARFSIGFGLTFEWNDIALFNEWISHVPKSLEEAQKYLALAKRRRGNAPSDRAKQAAWISVANDHVLRLQERENLLFAAVKKYVCEDDPSGFIQLKVDIHRETVARFWLDVGPLQYPREFNVYDLRYERLNRSNQTEDEALIIIEIAEDLATNSYDHDATTYLEAARANLLRIRSLAARDVVHSLLSRRST